jgi:hypothetical protein
MKKTEISLRSIATDIIKMYHSLVHPEENVVLEIVCHTDFC